MPNCHRPGIWCIKTTIRRLKRREAGLGCNHRAVFATTYRVLTEGILQAVLQNPHRFRWPRYLYYEDALFADVFIGNARAWDAGQRVSPAWRIAWQAAESSDLTASQDMLLGINAHVQNDMPFVIAALGTTTRGGVSRKPDHDLTNEILASSYQAVIDEVKRRYDPILELTNPQGTTADDTAGLELVRQWRETVWQNANRLIDAKTPAERDQVATEIEDNAARWAEAIVALPTPGYRPSRDAYCATHNPDA